MAEDQYTAQITADTITSVTGQYFDVARPFAFPRYGNACEAFTTGRDYFEAVAAAIEHAESFILITDWQLDYDVELKQRGVDKHPGRLSELMAKAIQKGIQVRVMLYDSVDSLTSLAGTPDTHEENAQKYFGELPKGKGSIQVMVQNPNTGKSITNTKNQNVFFSHHQKSIVIDGKIAFVGGLDLAYGRWDTNAFDVVIDPARHVINDAYNQQLVPARDLTDKEKDLTKKIGGRPGFQKSYGADGKVFDQLFQPRQPWQDVAVKVAGPAAFDVFVNFVLRWNSFSGSGTNYFDTAMAADWFTKAKGPTFLVDPLKKGDGSVSVQICRSASSKQLKDELPLWDDNHKYVNDDWSQPNAKRRKTVQAARAAWAGKHQTSILDAMVNCIRSAHGFIYIENQFFISECGGDQFGSASPAKNPIIAELANAIGQAIYAGRPFHVWLVLPEHPEGKIEEAGTASQAWWALQGVKRARNSLIKRINATLVEKNKKAWGLKGKPPTNKEIAALLKTKGMENKWREYLTVLNLRNYGNTKHYMVTEMVYIHSKLMIVDDAVAIIGSANINDRSLNGDGDTELSAVVVDNAEAKMTDVGHGLKIVTRKFARDLRMNQWKKHLGMLVDQKTTGVQKEAAAPNGIKIEQPLDMATIKGIQALAKASRDAYSEVFIHTPRDQHKTLIEGRQQAYPPLPKGAYDLAAVPKLQPAYMKTITISNFEALHPELNHAQPNMKLGVPSTPMKLKVHDVEKATATLREKVAGFWVEMPLDWGSQSDATPAYPANSPYMIASEIPEQNTSEAAV